MATGTATLDFGATPVDEGSVDVTGLNGLTSSTFIEAFFMRETTTDNGADEHEEAASLCPLNCEFLSASSFRIHAHPLAALGLGTFKLRWVYS
jgi:hypothetical protein